MDLPPDAVDPGFAPRITDPVMRSRTTVRAYKPDPVPARVVADILDIARCARSNSNSQPWRVVALAGQTKKAFGDALLKAHEAGATPPCMSLGHADPDAAVNRLGLPRTSVNDFARLQGFDETL